MRKPFFYLANILWLGTATLILYYLLIKDSTLHLSIADFFLWASHCTKQGHLFVIGFLPIYLGLIIFGVGLFLYYLRSKLCHTFFQYSKRCPTIERN